jgi:16S rRNA (uracil1498-N3)-methyltransferase
LAFVGALQAGACHPRQHFQNFFSTHARLPATSEFWVGPEGDFTPREMEQILASGVWPITLGPLVLRSETAALYGLSILSYELHAPAKPA